LFVCKQKFEQHLVYIPFSFEFFQQTKTGAITSSFSKFLKLEYISVSFSASIICLLSVWFHGFWHQTTGNCFQHQKQARKQAPENGQCVIDFRVISGNG